MKVSFNSNTWDRKVEALITQGFTTPCIERETNLTKGEINYRRGKLGFSVMDYWAGRSPHARGILKQIDRLTASAAQLRRQIEQARRRTNGNRRRKI